MISSIIVQVRTQLIFASLLPENVNPKAVMAVAVWITGFLCLLNIGLALFFRRRQKKEVYSYYAACAIELVIFVFALLFYLGRITQVPFHLPQHLLINQAEILVALAIGLGLFPAAYWHRINLSELPQKIAEDAKVHKNHTDRVYVRKEPPGEWMN